MNAIILAAGLGSRLRPLTLEIPKSQIEVGGRPMIERQIEFLRESGIYDITVVTGYLHHKFDYLKDKYGVKLVHNERFADYNNIYSMYLVRDLLGDSFVVDADVYLHRNIFPKSLEKSTYFSVYKTDFDNEEWVLKYDEHTKKLDEVVVVKEKKEAGRIMSGVSYWNAGDGLVIKDKLEEAIATRDFKEMYWDYMVTENLEVLDVYVEELGDYDVFEIDTLKDLDELQTLLENLK